MNTQNDFEKWLVKDFPESELARLPSGEYRNTTVRAQQRAFEGACAMFNTYGLLCRITGEDAYLYTKEQP